MIEILLAGMCAGCIWITLNIVHHKDPVVAGRVAEFLDQQVTPASQARPNLIRQAICSVGRRFPEHDDEAVKRQLRTAGLVSVGADWLRGLQLFSAGVGILIGLMAGPLAIVLSPALAWMGFRLPRIYLRRRMTRRSEQIAVALPDAVDLLAVCTHAGLNVPLSLTRVAGRTKSALGEELTRTLEEIELGVPRQIALRSLAERNPDGDLEALVSVLENAERFGTQISASLETFSNEVRNRRLRSAEEQARRAPIKILFPLVFLILPAFVLLSVVPLVLGAFSSLGI